MLVVHAVRPVLLQKYKSHPNITAILFAGVPGQESGNPIVDVLYGHVNPSAKLPFTNGEDRRDYGTDILYTPDASVPQINHQEGKLIDYKIFDHFDITPTYKFGFGLSYTSFEYSELKSTKLSSFEYVPFTGHSIPAPTLGNFSMEAEDHVFPANFTRYWLYHHRWINRTNLAESSADPIYGLPGFIPEGPTDGSAQPYLKAGGAPGGNLSLYEGLAVQGRGDYYQHRLPFASMKCHSSTSPAVGRTILSVS